jgi:hypothetical protein
MSEIGWLHLTDFHIGHSAVQPLLANVKAEFFEDLAWLHDQSGPWDILFFTGDLTQKGSADEFSLLDDFLLELMKHLARLGSKPLLLPVPGNHDLVRPATDARVSALKTWDRDQDVRSAFWRSGSEYQALVKQAFDNYLTWSRQLEARQSAAWRDGMLPGDFCTRVGALGVVGLNSAAIHFSDQFKAGTLLLGVEQLQAMLSDPPAWMAENKATLLLTHHPPEWLNKRSTTAFKEEIAPPGRFALHLYGHLHEPGARWTRIGGGVQARQFQGASLFSIVELRRKVQRIHGYSAGRITLEPELRLEVWPRRAMVFSNGKRAMILDPSFELDRSTQSFRDPPASASRNTSSVALPDLVMDSFKVDSLEQRLAKTQRLRMLVMRSSRWFAQRQQWLCDRLRNGLELEVLLPEPANVTLMNQLQSMYNDVNAQALAQSIRAVIGRLLEIRATLPQDRQNALRIATHEYYPPYSAYLFDEDEFWYIPYFRKPATLPVFVYRRRLSHLTVYGDFLALNVWWLTANEWKKRLANHISGMLDDLCRSHPAFAVFLQQLKKAGVRVFVFGGFVRDAIHNFVHGEPVTVRDLDLVIDRKIDFDANPNTNHFGGTRSQFDTGLTMDCWELASTFAFSRTLVAPATAANLPQTTIYRVNGCFFDLENQSLHGDMAVADIFARRVAFNCKGYLNTFAEYQAFRAIDLGERLSYELDAEVKEFVSLTLRTAGLQRFKQQVREHRPDLDEGALEARFFAYAKT